MKIATTLSNHTITGRLKQWAVLLVLIIVAMVFSNTAQAQDYHKSKSKHFKTKYKSQIKTNANACDLLAKKRNKQPRQPMFAFLKGKPKYKPQAEVDAPISARVASRKEKHKNLLASIN